MAIQSKYKSGFLVKRLIVVLLFAAAGTTCIILSQLKAFNAQEVIFLVMGGVAFLIMLFMAYNFLANRLESLEIGKDGLTFRNGLTRKPTLVAWKAIKRFGTGKSEHFMGLGTNEGDTSIVIETHEGDQYSFSEEEYSNFAELKNAFLLHIKVKS